MKITNGHYGEETVLSVKKDGNVIARYKEGICLEKKKVSLVQATQLPVADLHIITPKHEPIFVSILSAFGVSLLFIIYVSSG